MQIYIRRFILENKTYLHYSSAASNNLRMSDIGNTLKHVGIQEGTSLAAREGLSLGLIVYYRSIHKCTTYSTLKESRHPSAINLYLESCKKKQQLHTKSKQHTSLSRTSAR